MAIRKKLYRRQTSTKIIKEPSPPRHKSVFELRSIIVIYDGTSLISEKNFQAQIPKQKHALEYEWMYKKEDISDGVWFTAQNLLDYAYSISQNQCKSIFLITGKRIQTFREVNDQVKELVISPFLRMQGVEIKTACYRRKRSFLQQSKGQISPERPSPLPTLNHIGSVQTFRGQPCPDNYFRKSKAPRFIRLEKQKTFREWSFDLQQFNLQNAKFPRNFSNKIMNVKRKKEMGYRANSQTRFTNKSGIMGRKDMVVNTPPLQRSEFSLKRSLFSMYSQFELVTLRRQFNVLCELSIDEPNSIMTNEILQYLVPKSPLDGKGIPLKYLIENFDLFSGQQKIIIDRIFFALGAEKLIKFEQWLLLNSLFITHKANRLQRLDFMIKFFEYDAELDELEKLMMSLFGDCEIWDRFLFVLKRVAGPNGEINLEQIKEILTANRSMVKSVINAIK